MKIGVLLKQVPASDERIVPNADGSGIATDKVSKWIVNPYDELALESAIRLKEAKTASSVVLFTIGDKGADQRIRNGLAAGADEAIRLDDAAFADSDPLGQARIFAAAVKKAEVGLLMAGKEEIDVAHGMVPVMVAELLGWPQVSMVNELSVEGDAVTANRVMGGGDVDVVTASLPAVLTCEKGLPALRFTKLPDIMKAKRKKIHVWGAGDIGVDAGSVGSAGALVSESEYTEPPARPAGRIIEGDSAAAKVQQLVDLLRNEAKVI